MDASELRTHYGEEHHECQFCSWVCPGDWFGYWQADESVRYMILSMTSASTEGRCISTVRDVNGGSRPDMPSRIIGRTRVVITSATDAAKIFLAGKASCNITRIPRVITTARDVMKISMTRMI